ncbi:MAG TPA: MFS transporter [Streptosporangiaceae bacterium]|jgi:MFS family permease
MGQIGTLLLIAATTGSLGAAGLVAGGIAVGQAVGGPVVGGLADRRGQRGVTLWLSAANMGVTAVLLVAALGRAGLPVLVGIGVLTGLTIPQIAPLARARWLPLTAGRPDGSRLVSTAFSLEGALDELSFVAGPAVAGILAAAVHPGVALGLTALLVGVFGTAFALHRTTPGPAVHPAPASPTDRSSSGRTEEAGADGGDAGGRARTGGGGGVRGVLVSGPVVVLMGAMVLQGVVFGGTQTGVTALAEADGRGGIAGVLYAAMGVTSALAGLATAALPGRFGLAARLRVATGGMVVLGVPLVFVGGPVGLLTVLVVFGVAVGPYMITNFSLAERVVPQARLSTVMGMLTSGVVAGYAIGSSLGGHLADTYGHAGAFAVTLAATVLAFGIALFVWRPSWYRRHLSPERTPEAAEAA